MPQRAKKAGKSIDDSFKTGVFCASMHIGEHYMDRDDDPAFWAQLVEQFSIGESTGPHGVFETAAPAGMRKMLRAQAKLEGLTLREFFMRQILRGVSLHAELFIMNLTNELRDKVDEALLDDILAGKVTRRDLRRMYLETESTKERPAAAQA